MSDRRVVVTGIGVLCSLGEGIDVVWPNILEGRIGYDLITKFDTEGYSSSKVASEVNGFDASKYMNLKESKKTDIFIQFAIAAAQMAVDDAGLDVESVQSERFGVNIGSGIGGINEICDQQIVLMGKGPKRVSPFFIPNSIANLASGHVSIRFNAMLKEPCSYR